MASSLSVQLSQIAANSVDSLNLKTQKAAHSKSLLFEAPVAASQSFDTIYILCHDGFHDLYLLDGRFLDFQNDLFSPQSQEEDRTQMTAAQNSELDRRIESFLGLVSGRLRLNPAVKAVEWLIRRFRIHEYNTSFLLTTFLPYHTLIVFTNLLSILPKRIPEQYKFLHPYIRSLTRPPRHVIVHAATTNVKFASTLNSHVLRLCKAQQHHAALLAFWAGVVSEATSGMLDKARSGRKAVQEQNEQDVVLKLLPVLNEGLSIKKVPELRIACYMLLSIMASKGGLKDKFLNPMMEAVVMGWTKDTMLPSLVCLSVLAQKREAKQLPNRLIRRMTKVANLPDLLIEISNDRRVDRLANGFCLSLISRFKNKGESRGLPWIGRIVEAGILYDPQVKAVTKALILAAYKFNDENDATGKLRRDLVPCLVHITQLSGNTGLVVREAVRETEVDMDDLEMKLRTAILPPEAAAKPLKDIPMDNHVRGKEEPSFAMIIQHLPPRTSVETSFLSNKTSHIYDVLCNAFLIASGKSRDLEDFDAAPILRRQSATSDPIYLSFYMRIWCGNLPVIARVSALNLVSSFMANNKSSRIDLQAVLPYVLVALGDPAEKLRRAAASLLIHLGELYPAQEEPKSTSKQMKQWAFEEIYGRGNATPNIKWLPVEVASKFLREVLLPTLEECVLDDKHIHSVIENSISSSSNSVKSPKKPDTSRLSQAARALILAFLASHVVYTPLLLVKARILESLNRVRGVASSTRTKFLLPVLQQWAALSSAEALKRCEEQHFDVLAMSVHAVTTVVANDREGLQCLTSIIQGSIGNHRKDLLTMTFKRMLTMWPSLNAEVQLQTATMLLNVSQISGSSEYEMIASEEAADFLQSVRLSSEILLEFLSQLPRATQLVDKPPATKRRRTSHGEIAQLPVQHTQQISNTLRIFTFVLQLIDGSNPAEHPELLRELFNTLAELQHFKAHLSSELAYLQGLVFNSLVCIVEKMKSKGDQKLDRPSIQADLLVDCVQNTASPQVQNSALLLIASLAGIAPELILHSVMPIFTFLGSSVLTQNDEYSAHVIDRTIREVIPPLITSLRSRKGNLVIGASEFLLSFVTAYEHIPQHRRKSLFISLVQSLGSEEFLFALLAMLVSRYGPNHDVTTFSVDICSCFAVDIQLKTLVKYLELVIDLLQPTPSFSSVILAAADGSTVLPHDIAMQQLTLLPSLLSHRKLVTQISNQLEGDDMEAANVRGVYATMLETLLCFADTQKNYKALQRACGDVLESMLKLLSVNEFVKSVENLLDKTNESLRRKVLRSLEARVEQENISNVQSRIAMLNFLPQLTAIVRESTDITYKHTAITCIDKIAEKYGKKDLEAVSAAAETIAGDHCLGQSESRLPVMALLCLASLVEILREGIVPVLPVALPRCIAYLSASVRLLPSDTEGQKLHDAGYSFISALVQHLPYMMTSSHLESLLSISSRFAGTDIDGSSHDIRMQCLTMAARQIDAKSMFSALEREWDVAVAAGSRSLHQYIHVLSTAVERHPRSLVTKYSGTLAKIFRSGFDMKRRLATTMDDGPTTVSIMDNEDSFNAVALRIIYKFNDSTFRPIFSDLLDWATSPTPSNTYDRIWRLQSLYGFMEVFFSDLKSVVTSYAALLIDNATAVLSMTQCKDEQFRLLWTRVMRTLYKCFEHDQDDFWQSPSHFDAVASVLSAQFNNIASLPVVRDLIPTIVELAAAADSADHHKEINRALLMHMRSESTSIRLAAVKCELALTDRLGEEWLSLLPEMLPFISELQEDDDEVVEKETLRWIAKIEGVLGESLDAMLQ